MEADRTGLGKLDCIGKQVVYDLFYAVRIPIKPDLRILEIAVEQDTLVIDHVRESRSGTFQQSMKVERDIVAYLSRLVQVVHVQQVVEKVYHMAANDSDIVQINVPPFLLPCVHRQFGVAADDVQRGSDIVRQGEDDILAHIQQCGILSYRFFQSFPAFLLGIRIPLDDPVGYDQQENGRYDQTGDNLCGKLVCLFQMMFPVSEYGFRLIVQRCNQGVQFPVQFPIAVPQSVGIGINRVLPFFKHGDQLYVQRTERPRILGNLYGLFLSEPPGNAFFLAGDGVVPDCLFCHGWQMILQQTVGFILCADSLHDSVKMFFLIFQ